MPEDAVFACPRPGVFRSGKSWNHKVSPCLHLYCRHVRRQGEGKADITWQTPVTIFDTTDVSVDGTTVGTWGPGDDWGGINRSDYYPVNGVTFNA